jgi:hypothetical protein
MIKHLLAAMLVLTLVGIAVVPTAYAETADSILANKKQQNAPVLPPTSPVPTRRSKWWTKDARANRGW